MELEAVLAGKPKLVEFSVVWWAIKCVGLVLAVREPEGPSVSVEVLKAVLKDILSAGRNDRVLDRCLCVYQVFLYCFPSCRNNPKMNTCLRLLLFINIHICCRPTCRLFD